ncbi:E3 ubiquitin-protein ligase At3g02290-like isoform X3 [Vigna radiata var. radiata]|uniref:RING-type E3 ubiquitin transferase n=1 Tax=Vigna radiata var. radiata TaxID=3916 RepID=A0A3Q0EVK5_VIGRR|nr:E3 ubiquitin-protein ligase At3g02290-like isoform X3 [Vigna radiata var. radiata]
MGSVCCCFNVNDVEDYLNPNSPVYRNCMCFGCFIQYFLTVYASIFRRGEVHAVPSSIQGATPMTSTASLDNSLSDIYRSPPRPLPYDADPRFFRSQRDGLVSRRGKWNDTSEDGSKEYRKSTMRLSSAKLTTGDGVIYSSSEEEDCCPTCLEEYTEENPKIVTKCSHHFHLGCIYEWMERSDNCPVCGKVMVFDETT